MDSSILKDRMIDALGKIYYMEAFHQVVEFLQGELYILHYMLEHGQDGVNPSNLSDMLHISRPRVTAALSALRKKGFVQAHMDEDDRRRVSVHLTQEGIDFITRRQDKVEGYFTSFVEKLGREKAEELIGLLDLIVEMIDEGEHQAIDGEDN